MLYEDGGEREGEGQRLALPVFQILGQDVPLHLEFRPEVSRETSGLSRGHGDKPSPQVCSQTTNRAAVISVKSDTCSVPSLHGVKGCSPDHLREAHRESGWANADGPDASAHLNASQMATLPLVPAPLLPEATVPALPPSVS